MSAFKIILIHKGSPRYLVSAIEQAKFTNPDAEIVLIGDTANKCIHPSATWYDLEMFSEEAKRFAEIYVHLSHNPYGFELFCIQRWFILNAFLQQTNVEEFMYLDSDVLIYADVKKDIEIQTMLKNIDYTISGTNGGTSYFRSPSIIKDFCTFISDVYRNTELLRQLREKFERNESFQDILNYDGGTLQDMALLIAFTNLGRYRVADFSRAGTNPNFNQVINYPRCDTFLSRGNLISIQFAHKLPFAIEKLSLSTVRMFSLHFGGNAKVLMDAYSTFDKTEYWNGPILNAEQIAYAYGLSKWGIIRELILKKIRKVILNQ